MPRLLASLIVAFGSLPIGWAREPIEIRTPYYLLQTSADTPALRADADLLAHTLDDAVKQIVEDYKKLVPDADEIFRAASVTVHLCAEPNEHASVGQANVVTSWSGGKCTADIHLLAPSAHPDPNKPGAGRTMAGDPFDAAYCQRVLVHEYSTVFIESLTRRKSKGWSFYEAPAWFVQGIEEYFGTTYSTAYAREKTLPAYIRQTKEQSLVSCDFGLDVRSPYVAGPTLTAFMFEQYGREKLVALLRSEEQSFGKAARRELGVTVEQFYESFSKWLDAK